MAHIPPPPPPIIPEEDDEGSRSVRERRKDREVQNQHRYAGNRVIGTSGGAKDQEGGRPVVSFALNA